MTSSQYSPPAPDELELSVFGPGYGESIVLHLGDNQWVLVDSCIEPDSDRPASLKYLQNLQVDLESSVKMIVVSHWHDDHVRGMSSLLEECPSATFVISGALRSDEFLKLVALYSKATMMRSSGLDEFVAVFEVLKRRRQRWVRFGSPRLAVADRLLYRQLLEIDSETVEARIFSLSPSDEAKLQARLAFGQLVPQEEEPRKRISSPAPNHASAVLWAEVGWQKILLGSDLEKTTNPRSGWSVILSDSQVVSGQADAFKIPHHGSENAHHEGVWTQLLSSEPFAVLTPFRRGKRFLPTEADVRRINGLTPHGNATAPPRRRQQRWHQRVVRDSVEQMTRDIHDVHYGWGHVRMRRKIDEVNTPWQVEHFGDAYALSANS